MSFIKDSLIKYDEDDYHDEFICEDYVRVCQEYQVRLSEMPVNIYSQELQQKGMRR